MKKAVIITLSALFAAVVIFLIACPIVNDFSAKQVRQRLEALPLPENTRVAESFSRAGKLTGNGNGMQFFGAILIESELSLDQLEAYYTAYRKIRWDCIVERQEGKEITAIEHGGAAFQTDPAGGQFYIVYSWGSGLSPFRDFDLRGH